MKTEQITGDGDGDGDDGDEAPSQRSWGSDGNDGATAPPQAVTVVVHRCRGGAVGDRHRGASASTCGAVTPAVMVVEAALLGVGGGNPGGRSGPRDFWVLMDFTHLSRLVPNSQGVASPTNRGNRGGRSDATTDIMTEGVGQNPPPTKMKMGGGWTGLGGLRTGAPPTTSRDGTRTPGGPEGPRQRQGGETNGLEGAKGATPTPIQLGSYGQGPQGRTTGPR